jgi:hypothetical protein
MTGVTASGAAVAEGKRVAVGIGCVCSTAVAKPTGGAETALCWQARVTANHKTNAHAPLRVAVALWFDLLSTGFNGRDTGAFIGRSAPGWR